jgi:hypothetical protein
MNTIFLMNYLFLLYAAMHNYKHMYTRLFVKGQFYLFKVLA